MSDFNPELLNPKVQDFIKKNLKTDLTKIILKGSPLPNINIQEIAIQIDGKNRIEKKLPTWFKTEGILFPPKLNLEQSSSEITANYKAQLINNGDLIDLTGGFGVDDMAFTNKAKTIFHCELDSNLSAIVAQNAKVLGKTNVKFIIGDSKKFLEKTQKIATIYVDPSRRQNSQRVFILKDCEPNVVENQALYLKKADKVLIKAAPMLDISAALKELKKVSEVHIVSLNGECKELLFMLENKVIEETKVVCALLNQNKENVYEFSYSEEKSFQNQSFALQKYLYEPDNAILKGGFFKSVTQKFNVQKLNPNTHLYTSQEISKNFPGKTFEVIQQIPFNTFSSAKATKKANVVTRNFDLKPEEIKKQFKIKDGGEDFLFFITDHKENKQVIWAKKV
jgi:16S rRNA G966 N2-methylase RsmD